MHTVRLRRNKLRSPAHTLVFNRLNRLSFRAATSVLPSDGVNDAARSTGATQKLGNVAHTCSMRRSCAFAVGMSLAFVAVAYAAPLYGFESRMLAGGVPFTTRKESDVNRELTSS